MLLGTLLMPIKCFCGQALKLGVAYIIAQVLGGIVGAAAAFTSLPGLLSHFLWSIMSLCQHPVHQWRALLRPTAPLKLTGILSILHGIRG